MVVKRQTKNAVKITAPLLGRGQTIAEKDPSLWLSGLRLLVANPFLRHWRLPLLRASHRISMKTSIIKRKQTFSRDGATSSASAKASASAEASGSLALPNRREAAAALISDF